VYQKVRVVGEERGGGVEAIAVVLFEKATELPGGYGGLSREVKGALSTAIRRAEFSASKGAVTTVYPDPSRGGGVDSRVIVLGLGSREKFGGEVLRIAGAKMVQCAFAAGVRKVSLKVLGGIERKLDAGVAGRAVAEGISIGLFEFDAFKGKVSRRRDAGGKSVPSSLTVGVERLMLSGMREGLIVGESVNAVRRLAAAPPNVAHPRYLAGECRRIAARVGLRYSVIDAKRARRMGMGGLTAVGSAGSSPPVLICLEHVPRRRRNRRPILLVGKGVTFDTGGYSIKPGVGMESMKYDKCGGLAVIGAMEAIARMGLDVHVVGLVPSAENMIDANAYRPSDIIRMYNGVTVEVMNTDAEGRLILGDALAYGCEKYRPEAVVDLATLTGGVVVALGSQCAGVFCNHAKLRERLFASAEFTGERLWELPLWEEHRQLIKGVHADIANSGGREAHPAQGAAFLSYFIDPDQGNGVPKTPWAHLDIAGVAEVKGESGLYPKGPTGFGVRLLVRMIEDWKTGL
jgi:leucyl aminopeptidase